MSNINGWRKVLLTERHTGKRHVTYKKMASFT